MGKNIKDLSFTELENAILNIGEKKFRTKQIWEWLWQKNAQSFDEMTNLSKQTRESLSKIFEFYPISIATQQMSSDKTIKLGFRLHDGNMVEGVLIPSGERMTACISSQVGCNVGCDFCATAKLGFKRNLSASEIVDQVTTINNLAIEKYGYKLSNIVYMGMGEPLLNYKNVLFSVDRITSEDGLGMSPRRITISTSGITNKIKQLGDDNVKFNLALSLHSANDQKRSTFMPINDSNSLEKLTDAIKYFNEKTGSRPTFEYLLLGGYNDSATDAKELAHYCKSFPVKINLIEYNPNPHSPYKRSSEKDIKAFISFLESRNIIVNLRRSRGKDIDAACGQLANNDK